MWLQVLLNARANWKMKNRKLLESEISHPNVDIKIFQPASKSIMEMNEERKIFCRIFFQQFIFKLHRYSAFSNFKLEAGDLN